MSAGDYWNGTGGAGVTLGINRTARFELFGR